MEHVTDRTDSERVEVDVEVDAPPDEVWAALTSADELTAWLGADVELDVRPEGVGHVVDDDGSRREVLVTDVEHERRVAWHWWDDDGELSSVEITLEPLIHSTRVRVIETIGAASVPRVSACAGRWSSALSALSPTAALVSR